MGKTKTGKQLSDQCLTEKRLRKAGLNEEQIADVLEAIEDNDGRVIKLLIRNKLDGNLIVNILDKNAHNIGKATGF
ncbi:hypothetical protein CKO50_13530 [Pseudoalteromonas sp. HM-SA03]|nr:hypothetical protein CKO50_13530 [Pseudoalteromonas sp. HM-SA03]